jgi:hypothetical protein
MADEPSTNHTDPDLALIVVEGLRKISRLDPDETDIDTAHTECVYLPKRATLSELWSELEGKCFKHFGRPHRGESTKLTTFSFGLCSPRLASKWRREMVGGHAESLHAPV